VPGGQFKDLFLPIPESMQTRDILAKGYKHRDAAFAARNRCDETGDHGRKPESAEMFDSDMAVYLDTLQKRKVEPAHIKVIENNIALMKQWAAEGK